MSPSSNRQTLTNILTQDDKAASDVAHSLEAPPSSQQNQENNAATVCTERRNNVFQEQGATLCEANGRVVESISGTNEVLSPRRQRRLESEQIQFKKDIQQGAAGFVDTGFAAGGKFGQYSEINIKLVLFL